MMRKSISRIAFLALAALSAPDSLRADQVEVTFDTALTNTTAWTYSTGFEYASTQGMYGFQKASNGKDQISSPEFGFAITSVVIHAKKASAATTRKMSIRATSGTAGADAVELVSGVVPTTQVAFTSEYSWVQSDCVRSFALLSTSGNGNLYVKSAVISGVPIVDPPADVAVDSVEGTRCRLTWTNSGNISSNRIDVFEVERTEEAGANVLEYDFGEFKNESGNSTDITGDFTNAIPSFAGSSVIRLPARSDGVIQVSQDDKKGYLVHSGFEDCSDLSLTISLRIPTNSQGKQFGMGYENAAGETNQFPLISMSTNFVTNVVSLAELPANTPLIFNTEGAGSKRVVYIDYIAFADGHARATVSTNFVKSVFATDSATCSVRGLAPWTDYVARVTAFDADGNESAPSPPVDFATNGGNLPFVIMLK